MGVRGLNSFVFLFLISGFFKLDLVYSYTRPPAGETILTEHLEPDEFPQQVHISQVGKERMAISWITKRPTPTVVYYGLTPSAINLNATGQSTKYGYLKYKSGQIHYVVIGPLKDNTVYHYHLGLSSKDFSFKTAPSHFPIKFAVAGDLGQTKWTRSTLDHISKSKYDMLLLPGDLAYADFVQHLWDSFGRLVAPLASQRPWMVTQGNHEVEKLPKFHKTPFTAYNARWKMPYKESGSDSNLYYSFEVAGVHVIMLGSYADFDSGSNQYKWLQKDLSKVNRKNTPWLVVLIHAPWYNSNTAHQGEKESVLMKASMEDLLYQARVDVIFAGHVHAYERFTRVHKDKSNKCGPIHITIGDGGNREGLATKYIEPKPEISLFREANFGHGTLEMFNATHALWNWHKNDNDAAVVSDSVWLKNLQDCKV